ncbi:MAG: methyltransferase domain-containing protein [Defluviitaleaceae bacterium]|nr:methyltransferase domain-containing protein [Defluviitaleaceae bacterium]MCL2275229.1 methyltransferase domain-containing protein [Defluviitaleaceae bacterium]
MRSVLAGNIARYRKQLGLTQEALAGQLNISFQAVSKWETGQTVPDTLLLPAIARALQVSIDTLLGYAAFRDDTTFYETAYKNEGYYWGVAPNRGCFRVLELMPPTRRVKLLDIGCGEGKDAVFFARCGYDVTAFDISEAGVEKTRRLAEAARVQVQAFRANILDYRLDAHFDVLYSSGVLHYVKPTLRDEIMANYKAHVNENGLVAFNVFVEKPFIPPPPEDEERHAFLWQSGELLAHFAGWLTEGFGEYVFDCDSSGIPHKHAMNVLYSRKV